VKQERGWRCLEPELKQEADEASAELTAMAAQAHASQPLSQWEGLQLRGVLKALGRPTTPERMQGAIKEAAALRQMLSAARQESVLEPPVAIDPISILQGTLEPHRSAPLATLSDKQLAELNLKRRLARLVLQDGYRPKEALEVLGLPQCKLSWARRVVDAAREGRPLHDQRAGREIHCMRKRTPRLREAIWSAALALRGANTKATIAALARQGKERLEGLPAEEQLSLGGLAIPSYSTIWRELKSMPKELRLLRTGGKAEVTKHGAVVGKRQTGEAANVRWEIDHTRLDVWCRRVENGTMQACEVWVTAIIDTFSRRVMSVVVNDHPPTSWTVIRAVKAAVRVGGQALGMPGLRPETLVMDNGKDLISDKVDRVLQELGITRELCRPHDPNAKGKIERWMRTVTDGFCAQLMGGMVNSGRSRGAAEKRLADLHDLVTLARELGMWVTDVYNATPHSRTGATPHSRWLDCLRPAVVTEEALATALLPVGQRQVTPEGIHYTHDKVARRYVWPDQQLYLGQKVELRLDPDAPWSVQVYQGAQYLGEAFDRDDPAAAAGWAAMMERSKSYRQNVVKLGETMRANYAAAERERLSSRSLTISEQLMLDEFRRQRQSEPPVEEQESAEEAGVRAQLQHAMREAAAQRNEVPEHVLVPAAAGAPPVADPTAPASSEDLEMEATLRALRGQRSGEAQDR